MSEKYFTFSEKAAFTLFFLFTMFSMKRKFRVIVYFKLKDFSDCNMDLCQQKKMLYFYLQSPEYLYHL